MSEMVPFDPNQEIGEFDFGDLGNIPEISKEAYSGKVIVIVGISEGTFEGEFDTPAKSILHYMPEDDRAFNPWGLLLSETSPAVKQAQGQLAKNGGKPFYARVVKKMGSKFPYWTLEPVKVVFTQDGQIGGFRTKEGEIISNADAALPMPERKTRK
jgi:hypothetical protein